MRVAAVVLLLASSISCFRHRSVELPPNQSIDGAYHFSVKRNNGDIYGIMEGRFVIADTQVFLYTNANCELADTPRTSDGQRATWFDCNRTREGGVFQLRISQTDPINKSLWYSRSRELNTVTRCIIYSTSGTCTRWGRARGMEWVNRYGPMMVTRGLPVPLDTGRAPVPGLPRQLKSRCDTTAIVSCNDSRRGTR
jgi:hypothetical protein